MSFSISSRSEILTDRLFVEASAGTGKTYVIEHYIVRSILSSPFVPEKLALITFTKAVARELRQRLKTTLQNTLACLVEEESASSKYQPPDYLLPFLAQDAFSKRKKAREIEEALERLDEAAITTIHGFCDRLVTKWEEESGCGRVEEWIGEEEKKKWIEEFLQEGGGLRGGEIEVISRKYRHDQQKLVDHLATLMNDVQIEEEGDTAWEEAKKTLEKVREKVSRMAIAEALGAMARGYRGNMKKDGTLKQEIAEAFSAIESLFVNGIAEETLDTLTNFSLIACFETPLAKRTQMPAEQEECVKVVLEELWPALQELVLGDRIVARLSQRCAKAFLAFLQKAGKKTPQTILRRAVDLSAESSFRKYAAEHVEWLIVDEFQDTDALQYTIFSRLFLSNPLWHGHALFVGDPKQAIYGFRKADVYSYLVAKEALLPHEVRTLSVNYRGEKEIVEAQNRLFAGKEQASVFYLPRAKVSLTVVPSSVGKSEKEYIGDSRGAVHFFVAHHHLGRKRRWPHDEMEQTALFPWIADEMISLERLGVPFRQQAILVKDRYQARRVLQFLAARRIPTCAWRVDSITDSPIFLWLQRAFFLASRPHDPSRLSSLLLTFPTQEHLELCRAMASDKRLDQWASCAAAWGEVKDAFYEGGVAYMARSLLACRFDSMRSVEEWLRGLPEGGELLIDVEHLFELLSLLEPVLPFSLEAYGEALHNIASRFSEEPETLIRRTDPDDEGVPILTMHRSKGLEFDVVFALGAASRTPKTEELPIDEADAEKIRQLYVSITRAKRRCYLPLLIDDDERAIPEGQASPLELLCAALTAQKDPSLGWTSMLYDCMSGASRLALAEKLSSELPSVITLSEVFVRHPPLSYSKKESAPSAEKPLPKLSFSKRSYRSFSSGESEQKPPVVCATPSWISSSMPVTEESLLREKEIAQWPYPAIFGIRFHCAISKLIFALPEVRASVEKIREWLNTEGGGDEEMAQRLYDALHVLLPIGDETVCLEEIPRSDMRVECAFLDKEDGERYIRGSIDLLFVWKGAIYIVDWKTNAVQGKSCHEEVERMYLQQHRLYLEAAVRSLSPEFRYGGFFFVFVRHLHTGGIVACPGGYRG